MQTVQLVILPEIVTNFTYVKILLSLWKPHTLRALSLMPNFLVHRLSHIPALRSVPHHTSPFPSLFSLYPPLPPKADSFWFRSDTLFRRLFVVPGMPHTLWLCRLVRVVSALLKTNKVSTWMFGAHASFSGWTCRINPAGGKAGYVMISYTYLFLTALRPNGGPGLLNQEATRSHTTTRHSR